jgi:outer membrane lipopolysaccharide assembly protein LptE/RlpB
MEATAFTTPCATDGRRPGCGRALGLLAALLLGLVLVSCGYRFQGPGTLPKGISRIFVETFENRTSEAALDSLVTSAVVFEFTKRNKSALAPTPEEADAVLKGVIQSLSVQTVSTRGKDAAGERRVTMRMDLRLVQKDGNVVWAAKGLSDNETFSVSDDKFLNERKQRGAVGSLATRVAERVYNRFTDDF